LEHLAEAPLPTSFGDFKLVVFRFDDPEAHPDLSREHLALVKGDVKGAEDLLVRVHSECLTGEVFSSLKCDCKDQLEYAQNCIHEAGAGIILYLRQEGRGIGLANKIKAYSLQAEGADTIAANRDLHLPIDARDYLVAKEMLAALDVKSIRLLTNNPIKRDSLRNLGVKVTGLEPVHIAANPHSEGYLQVKRDRMNHLLPEDLTLKNHTS
jgi:GTP cyclohydrolase II